MTSVPLPRPLTGIVPPMVTPLSGPDCLDAPAVERLVRRLLDGGVHGLFILGTTGEGPSLSYRVRRELITLACRSSRRRAPVLVGVTDTAAAESLAIAEVAAEAGAAAVVLAPPPYFRPSSTELLGYLRRFADDSPLPVVLYNMPALTKLHLEPEIVLAAAAHPNIAGLKDSSGDLVYFHRVQHLLSDRPDFSLLVGPEELLAESVLVGGHGGVNGGANLRPELYVALYEAARCGDLPEVRRLHAQVIALSNALYGVAGGGLSMVRSLKAALALQGICRDEVAEPFSAPSPAERTRVAECLAALDPIASTPR